MLAGGGGGEGRALGSAHTEGNRSQISADVLFVLFVRGDEMIICKVKREEINVQMLRKHLIILIQMFAVFTSMLELIIV